MLDLTPEERLERRRACYRATHARHRDERNAKRREQRAANYESERQKEREHQRAHYARHREAILSKERYGRAWIAAHRENARRTLKGAIKLRKQMRRDERRASAVIRKREAQRLWRLNNPDRRRDYRKAGKMRRRALAKGAERVERVVRSKIIERDGLRCYICKWEIEVEDVHLDHIVPLARGGTHTYDNIAVACSDCNILKSDRLCSEIGVMPPVLA